MSNLGFTMPKTSTTSEEFTIKMKALKRRIDAQGLSNIPFESDNYKCAITGLSVTMKSEGETTTVIAEVN